MPFKDLQGVLNDQFHVISDLFTASCLCLRILSYNRTISSYSVLIDRARVELVTISYSKEIFEISYLASGTFGDDTADLVTQL